MLPQNIRINVPKEEFEVIANGAKSYIFSNISVSVGDYITIVPQQTADTNEFIVKQVGYIDSTKTENGENIVGLLPPDYGALAPFFENNRFVLGFGIEKGTDKSIKEIYPSAYLPPMTTPFVPLEQVAEVLNIDKWPAGQYSIIIQAEEGPIKDGEQQLQVTEFYVSVRTKTEDDDDVFVEVKQLELYVGKLVATSGKEVIPYFGNNDKNEENESDFTTEFLDTLDDDDDVETNEDTEEDFVEDINDENMEEWALAEANDAIDKFLNKGD